MKSDRILGPMSIIGIVTLMFVFVAPRAADADWKVYCGGVIGQNAGTQGRGSFPTRAACEQARAKLDAGSQKMCNCSGNDSATAGTSGTDLGSFFFNLGAQLRQREEQEQQQEQQQEKQKQLQLQQHEKDRAEQDRQRERDLEAQRQQAFEGEKDQLLKALGQTDTGTEPVALKGTVVGGLELKTGEDAPLSTPADATPDMRELTRTREELYRVQMDQQNITERFGGISREFSDIGTETGRIIAENKDKLGKTVLEGTLEVAASGSANWKLIQQAYDTIQTVRSYPEIKDTDSLAVSLKRAVGYIGKVSVLFGKIDWTITAAEPWWDVFKERQYLKRLPELELECQALILDTDDNRTHQRELMQKIDMLRQRIHEASGVPLEQIPATPLRPAGIDSYVPRLFPTEGALVRAQQQNK